MGNVEVELLTEVEEEEVDEAVVELVVDILIARTRRRMMAIEDEITTRGHFNPTAGQDSDFISLIINPSFRNLLRSWLQYFNSAINQQVPQVSHSCYIIKVWLSNQVAHIKQLHHDAE